MKRCKMCGNKIVGYNSLKIEYQFGFGSKHDGDVLKCCLCPKCIDKIADFITRNSKVNPVIEISKVS